jgi:hypothetical protein
VEPETANSRRRQTPRIAFIAASMAVVVVDGALAIRIQKTRNETELIEKDTEPIRRGIERLRQENARLRTLNLRTQNLLSCVDQICSPPESSSIHPAPTEPEGSI